MEPLTTEKGWHGRHLMSFVKKEAEYHGKIDAAGYCSPTWRLQRALRDLLNGTYLQGESAVTARPFFDGPGRGASPFWGKAKGPTVILWDSLDEEGCVIVRCLSLILMAFICRVHGGATFK
jgi:hypothetical protein